MKKRGIPKEVLDELNISKIEKQSKNIEITPIVETHQVKLPVPSIFRREIDWKKGKKIKVNYDPKSRKLTYKI